MSLLINSFKYFAKFPQLEGVLKNFNRNDSSVVTGYADLKNEIANLPTNSLVPGIVDYVFGIDETTIKSRIKEIRGIYQFLDYGGIFIERDNINREYTEFLLALNIARPMTPNKTDLIEEIMLGDEMLQIIQAIRDIMKTDQRGNPFVQELEFPHEITPFYSPELSNSVGWTMIFKKRGIGIL